LKSASLLGRSLARDLPGRPIAALLLDNARASEAHFAAMLLEIFTKRSRGREVLFVRRAFGAQARAKLNPWRAAARTPNLVSPPVLPISS
jgi:hypothetical protein